jgi:hypothetical protein
MRPLAWLRNRAAGGPLSPHADLSSENVDSIKILQVDGLATGVAHENSAGSPSDQIVQSTLKYRVRAPLIDSLFKELGLGRTGGACICAGPTCRDRQGSVQGCVG